MRRLGMVPSQITVYFNVAEPEVPLLCWDFFPRLTTGPVGNSTIIFRNAVSDKIAKPRMGGLPAHLMPAGMQLTSSDIAPQTSMCPL